jgi:hypothetical protein
MPYRVRVSRAPVSRGLAEMEAVDAIAVCLQSMEELYMLSESIIAMQSLLPTGVDVMVLIGFGGDKLKAMH